MTKKEILLFYSLKEGLKMSKILQQLAYQEAQEGITKDSKLVRGSK